MLGSLRAAVGTKQNSVQREDLKRDPGSQPPTIRPPGLRPPLTALPRLRPPAQASANRPFAFRRVAPVVKRDRPSRRLSLPASTFSEVSFPLSSSSPAPTAEPVAAELNFCPLLAGVT
jgi:hypothetical protein